MSFTEANPFGYERADGEGCLNHTTVGSQKSPHSPRRSPPMLVPKPDNSILFCIDVQKLNGVSYLIHKVDALLVVIGNTRGLSTIDLTKRYWQIPLVPNAQGKNAFANPQVFITF